MHLSDNTINLFSIFALSRFQLLLTFYFVIFVSVQWSKTYLEIIFFHLLPNVLSSLHLHLMPFLSDLAFLIVVLSRMKCYPLCDRPKVGLKSWSLVSEKSMRNSVSWMLNSMLQLLNESPKRFQNFVSEFSVETTEIFLAALSDTQAGSDAAVLP